MQSHTPAALHGGAPITTRKHARLATALPYAAAFLIPFAILLLAFASHGIWPFGDVSVMICDMPVQYAEYFGWLIQVLHGDADLLYSNAAGLGGGTFSLFTYYLSSPFNLLAWFFTPETVPQLFSLLYLVKIPACALACLMLLRGRLLAPEAPSWQAARRECAAAPLSSNVALVLLACAYALTSYVLGYASNIMWLDGVIMAPLALLGTYRLVQRRACAGLFAACGGAVLFNWYTGYMVCLLAVLFFFYELARARNLRGARLRRCGLFAATMLLAVGTGMVVLLPTALSLLGGKGAGAGLSSLSCDTGLARNPLAVADLFGIGTTPGITTQANRPAVVVSALALVGIGIFFVNGAVGKRERIAGAALFLTMGASLVLVPLATVWSGFVPESSYTNRNGFAILLVIVLLAGEGLLSLKLRDKKGWRRSALTGGGAALASFAASAAGLTALRGGAYQSTGLAVLECVLLAAYTLLLALAPAASGRAQSESGAAMHEGKTAANGAASAQPAASDADAFPAPRRPAGCKLATAALCVLLVGLFAFEQLFDAKAQLASCRYSVSGYARDLDALQDLYAPLSGEGFARVGNAAAYWADGSQSPDASKANGPDNMALVLGLSTFDHYSSTQETRIQKLLRDLGYSKVTPFGTYYRSPNPAADALLAVTDVVNDGETCGTVPEGGATLRSSWQLRSNELALPLGWGCAGEGSVAWSDDPFANQSLMIADAAGAHAGADEEPQALYHEATVEDAGSTSGSAREFTVTTTSAGPLLLHFPTLYLDDVYYEGGIACSLSIDGGAPTTVGMRGSCNVVYAGDYAAGQTVHVSLTSLNPNQTQWRKDGALTTVAQSLTDPQADEVVKAQTLDADVLREQLARIKANGGFSLSSYENGRIAATFDAEEDEMLVISQPYEDGWSVTVNGQPAELEPAYDGLMGVHVSAGENDVELRYLTPGLVPGAVVSIASVTLFSIWRIAARKRSMGRSEAEPKSKR